MNTLSLALALATACCSTLQAHAASTLHDAMQATTIGKRSAERLGFKGSQEVGSGLKTVVHLGIRYDPDAAQGHGVRLLCRQLRRVSAVGQLSALRIGRATTACMAGLATIEPLPGFSSPAGFQTTWASVESTSAWVLGANHVLAGGALLTGFGSTTSCQKNLHILPDRQCLFR